MERGAPPPDDPAPAAPEPEARSAPAPEEPAAARQARRKPQTDIADARAQMERARAEGQLPKALVHARRLLELDPEDPALRQAAAEIESAIQEKELEQLCEMALSYAAEGDVELAAKIAGRIERMAPESPRYKQLRAYLNEETARRRAKLLTGQAGDQLAEGDLEGALKSAEEALEAYPSNSAAREIAERVSGILVAQGKRPLPSAAPAPEPPPAPPEQPEVAPAAATPAPEQLTPLPEGPPANPQAAALVETARRLLRDRDPQGALRMLEQAADIEREHAGLLRLLTVTRVEARRAEVESLTTAALGHFVRNEHRQARAAVEEALALDPKNRKALELRTILGALG